MRDQVAALVRAKAEDGRPGRRGLLRFLTCGSVDDGKSTLIGRLLYGAKALLDDQLAALESDSRRFGTQGDGLDFALLLDGLAAEREQGITIDVAYRFFATARRKFIVADAPGHEQYTRNMITAASNADAAVLLVDARKGLLTQTRRHAYLAALLGIRHFVVALNKFDLVGFAAPTFDALERECRQLARQLRIPHLACVPVSGLHGDNVVDASANTPWYGGPTLLECLEAIDVADERVGRPLRMLVQGVIRPHDAFRGYAVKLLAGALHRGERVVALPSGRESRIARIVTLDGDLEQGVAGQSITVTLDDEIDVGRGDVLCAPDAKAPVAAAFTCTLVWMDDEPMLPGRPYLVKIGALTTGATFSAPEYRVDVDTLEQVAVRTLGMNEIGLCRVHLARPVAFERYGDRRELGGFIVIDRVTQTTAGAGLIQGPLDDADNVPWQTLTLDKAAQAALKGHRPALVWLTGLSGAGKSTIANCLATRLHAAGRHTCILDGDNLRHGMNRDLGFSDADRVENVRRVAHVARLMVDAGLIVIVALISPFRAERRMARDIVGPGEFCEVFVDTPLDVAEARDPKGLYRKAREGRIADFTGIGSPYEVPEAPEVRIDTTRTSPEVAADVVLEALRRLWSAP